MTQYSSEEEENADGSKPATKKSPTNGAAFVEVVRASIKAKEEAAIAAAAAAAAAKPQ